MFDDCELSIGDEIANRLAGIILVCYVKRCTINVNGRMDSRTHILKAYTRNEMFQSRVNRALFPSLHLTFDPSSSFTQNVRGIKRQAQFGDSHVMNTTIVPVGQLATSVSKQPVSIASKDSVIGTTVIMGAEKRKQKKLRP